MASRPKRKLVYQLQLVMIFSVTLALLVSLAAVETIRYIDERGQARDQAGSLAQFLAQNIAPALVFRNRVAADSLLASMNDTPNVLSSIVYDENGQVFAAYRMDEDLKRILARQQAAGMPEAWSEGRLAYSLSPVVVGGEIAGWVGMVLEGPSPWAVIAEGLAIAGGFFVIAGFLAILISRRLIRGVLGPMYHFLNVMRVVGRNKNYSIRVPAERDDELGEIFRGFNDMLSQIEYQEAMLAESEERYRTIVESQTEAICRLDHRGRIRFCNRAFQNLVGRTREEMLGRFIEDLLVEQDKDAAMDALSSLGPLHSTTQVQCRVRGASGDLRWLQATVKGMFDARGYIREYLAVGRDISKQKIAEQKAVQASKLASLGEISTGIAHELKQPLSVIQLVAQNVSNTLEVQDLSREEEREYVIKKMGRINESIDRIRVIVDHLRVFGRKVESASVEFDPCKSVDAALLLIQHRLDREGIVLSYDATHECGLVRGHPILFEQVLLNLFNNACDAMAERHAQDPAAPHEIKIEVRRRGNFFVLIMQDTGGGVPEHVLAQAFEPYFTTKPPGKGTGLGLSISRDIVAEMKGIISIRNHGEGAEVRIELPVQKWHVCAPIKPDLRVVGR